MGIKPTAGIQRAGQLERRAGSHRHLAVSIIIPVYNEELTIARLLENLKRLGDAEIIVADGGSHDRTCETAAPYARIVTSKRGRAAQMNAGVEASTGDVLLFLHADVRLGGRALDAIREALEDPAVMGGNFRVEFDGGDLASRIFSLINDWRARCGVFYGDSGIFCRRSAFQQIGGYAEWPIMEDYHFARKLRKAGRLALLREPIYVSDRRWRKAGLFVTMWLWFIIQTLFMLGVSPHRLARLYRDIR